MKPLVIMTTFGRPRETMATLDALAETTDFHQVEMAIVDNGSGNEMTDAIEEWFSIHARGGAFYPLPVNIGCPRALNLALRCNRKRGQPVVKLDNDVRILTPGWVDKVSLLIKRRQAKGAFVAMLGAYYDGVLDGRLLQQDGVLPPPRFIVSALHRVFPVIGHAVWHTGVFMDAVGYFDVLADDHLYGFEDLLLSHKAQVMGWEMLVWEGWQIENIQRHSALGRKAQDEHVERMRPLYDRRCGDLQAGGPVLTVMDGQPLLPHLASRGTDLLELLAEYSTPEG